MGFQSKKKGNRKDDKYKVRLVVGGFFQIYHINFEEIFSFIKNLFWFAHSCHLEQPLTLKFIKWMSSVLSWMMIWMKTSTCHNFKAMKLPSLKILFANYTRPYMGLEHEEWWISQKLQFLEVWVKSNHTSCKGRKTWMYF